ncbi:MAG: lipid-A-disaccharide synthase [Bacteroidetes bacterium]|nr:lipid-A-disaccharide synthase [Bacteroidota bacterium]MDA1336414.1 lipid-A-disaccharide synthase [Bacteroidota bacterium]
MDGKPNSKQILRVFILAGEASGDAYGGQLVNALKKQNPSIEIRAWGGNEMESAGAVILRHYESLAFMGIWEVMRNLTSIRKLFKECKAVLKEWKPDVFIGIDYPGFNLRMARFAHDSGLVTHHFISPSVWAWKKNRIKSIARDIDHLHVILPFEERWYAKEGMKVHWVGHPLLEILAQADSKSVRQATFNPRPDQPILLLMPGSRIQELRKMLPVFVEAVDRLPQFQPVIAGAPGLSLPAYSLAVSKGIPVVFDQSKELMQLAQVGLVTSGTASLEAALIGLPQVIAYRTSGMTYQMAKVLVKSKWIGLPNILLEKSAVPELIQSQCTSTNLVHQVLKLHDGKVLTSAGQLQQEETRRLHKMLQGPSAPSELVAKSVLQSAKS